MHRLCFTVSLNSDVYNNGNRSRFSFGNQNNIDRATFPNLHTTHLVQRRALHQLEGRRVDGVIVDLDALHEHARPLRDRQLILSLLLFLFFTFRKYKNIQKKGPENLKANDLGNNF